MRQLDEVTPERYSNIVVVPPVSKLQLLSVIVASTFTAVVVAGMSVIVLGLLPLIVTAEMESGIVETGIQVVTTLQLVQPLEELNWIWPATLPEAIP